ncbi:hypothetical protein DA2_1604 [Desulfovibrio sp. A2]|nr:hypothetical protein DA2_1604 [Desulfovibrio sp. A2]
MSRSPHPTGARPPRPAATPRVASAPRHLPAFPSEPPFRAAFFCAMPATPRKTAHPMGRAVRTCVREQPRIRCNAALLP